MLCAKVTPLLSGYFDEVLDDDNSIQVSQHLDQCTSCRKELDDLSAVHNKLKSLKGIQAPEFLRNMVQLRLADMDQDRWPVRIQNTLERRWSIIRTTEGMWYMSKALGIVMTAVFFFLIPCSINPLEIEANSSVADRAVYTRAEKQRVALNVVAKLGMLPKDVLKELARVRQPVVVKPAIHEKYLSRFGESFSQDGNDYDFAVVTYVAPNGKAQGQNVLEYPNAQNFLNSFNKVISSGRFAPARENGGEAVPSHMLLMFSKISVYPTID
jgi:hypothetical protein